jgi:hypothetical protein
VAIFLYLMRFTVFNSGLLLALPGHGQAPIIPTRPVCDSAFAVHQLFSQRRLVAEVALGSGAVGIVAIVTGAARRETAVGSVNILMTVVSAAMGLRQALRYSPKREEFIVQQYERGWPLPSEVRRRLKAKYFRGR